MILEEDGEDNTFRTSTQIPGPSQGYVTADVLNSSLRNLEAKLVGKITENKQEFDAFKEDCMVHREKDLYMFADQSERSDYASNLLKAHIVLITGKKFEP
jgi:hypothetical protein